MDFNALYEMAKAVAHPRRLSAYAEAGGVGAAILTRAGHVYTGVCVDTSASMGFCAEHAAAAAMLTQGESEITKLIAVRENGTILPPCGRCREFLTQLHADNKEAEVKVEPDTVVKLKDLLPYDWKDR